MMKTRLLGLLVVLGSLLTTTASAQYCTAGLYTTGCTYGDNLENVVIGSFSDLNTACSPNGYGNFSTDTITIAQTEPNTISITSGYSNQYYAIWIDANDDGDFSDAGEFIWNSSAASGTAGTPTIDNFTLSGTFALGAHRMRIRGNYSTQITSLDACANFNYGETHDYTVNVVAPPACPAPYNISVDSITSTVAYVSWTSLGTSFNIEYDTTGFAFGTGNTTTSTTNSVAITGLTPNTKYDFYVQNNCATGGNGTSNWSYPISFTTGCAPYTTPYFNDFEAEIGSGWPDFLVPNCWNKFQSNPSIGNLYTLSSTWTPAYSGNVQLTIENNNAATGGDTLMFILPELIGLENGDKQLVFRAKNGSSTNGDIFIGTVNSPINPTSLDVIDTITLTATYDEHIVLIDALSGYNGTDRHLVIGHANTNDYATIYIDDVEVMDIPACPKPLFLSMSNISNSSAVVSWTSPGSSFEIEYGPVGFTQGTGSVLTSTHNADTLVNLAGNTCYDVYVRRDCGIDGTSVWAGPIEFCTYCNPMQTPISENFDNALTGSFTNPSEPDCWTYIEEANHNGAGYTQSSSWNPANSAPNNWYMFNSSSTSSLQMLVSPEIATITTNPVQVKFYARGFSNGNTIVVGTLADLQDINTFHPIDTIAVTTNYAQYTAALTAQKGYNGTDQYVAIAHGNSSAYIDLYIDDIVISDIPLCYPSSGFTATSVTSTSAVLNWKPGQGISQSIEYGVAGFTQGTGTPITGILDSTLSLTGLLPNTCYEVYVKDSCGANGNSPWDGPFTFCTQCVAFQSPLVEDFESATVGSSGIPTVPECWSYYESPNGNGYGYVYSDSWNPANSGDNQYFMYNTNNSSSGDTLLLISPEITGLDSNNRELKFFARKANSFIKMRVVVGTVEDPSKPQTFAAIDTIDLTDQYTEYSMIMHTAIGYDSTHSYIAFAHANDENYSGFYMDDISVEKLPSCTAPFNYGVSNITPTGGQATWTSVSGTSFKVEVGPEGFAQGTGAGVVLSNATSPATFSGLTPNTYYDLYIADYCDTTVWAGPFTFKTACLGQLSGSYTVGGPVGPTNFATLDSALSVLMGCGVSGPVTFNLAAGTYTKPIHFGEIEGSTPTNMVTFNGNGYTDSISVSFANAAIHLDGTRNITFKNMTIANVTGDMGVAIYNAARNITFKDVHIVGSTTMTGFSSAGIRAANIPASSSNGDNVSNITVEDVVIKGFNSGIVLNGENFSKYNSTIVVKNVVVEDANDYAVSVNNFTDVHVENVTVKNLRYAFGYALSFNNCDNLVVTRNKAIGTNVGIYLFGINVLSNNANAEITNNFSVGNSRGMTVNNVSNTSFLNNSTLGNTGIYLTGTIDSVEFVNNIFSGSILAFESAQWGLFNDVTLDYNLYHSTGANLAYWNSSNHTDLTAWQAADTASNANSIEGDPIYISNTDLHVIGTLANNAGDASVNVLVDIDENPRSATTPDIGADEYDVFNVDARVSSLVSPTNNTCGDSSIAVFVAIQNVGQNALTTTGVGAEVNGNVISTTYTGNLALGESDTVLVGTFTQIAGATVSIKAFTNLVGDQNTSNDTLIEQREISDASMPMVVATADTICEGGSFAMYLTAPASGKFIWYDSNNDTVATANAADTVYVANQLVNETYTVVEASFEETLGASYLQWDGTFSGAYTEGLRFDLSESVRIDRVSVYPDTAGQVVVNITDVNSGVLVYTDTFNVNVAAGSPAWLSLGSTLPAGTYDMTADGTSTLLFRSNYGVTYPYNTTSDKVSIVRNAGPNAQLSHYYFFYDWVVSVNGCNRPLGTQEITIMPKPTAAFTFNVGSPTFVNQTVSFDASTSALADSVTWNFGDGNIGSGVNTSHDYNTNGNFVVTMVAYNACGTDTITDTVNTNGINIEESVLGQSLNVYPNPNDGKFQVEFTTTGLQNISLNLVNSIGQSVYFRALGNVAGDQRLDIDVDGVAPGVYVLQVTANGEITYYKLSIQ